MLESPRPHAQPGRPPLASVAGAVAALALGSVFCAAMLHGPAALAGPTGGQVVAGSGSIQRPNVDTTLIQQQTRSMAIDWTGFDVAGHETVRFQQPSSSSAVLNRVLNELPSQIHGRIEANGQVFIMNPNGIVFGPGSRVEVGALFASSLDIDVHDFMNEHYQFAAPDGAAPGAVINSGLIKAATGGSVALIGGAVRNDGVIIADLGHVLMGAGREALVDFDGDGLIRFHVDEAVLAKVSDQDGAVLNSGEIQADGGQVLLSASVARGIVDRAVNNQGVIRAASIDRSTGSVRLSAVGAGAANAGAIDVSASDAGVHGGQVIIESTELTLLEQGSTVLVRSVGGRGGEVRVLGGSVAMLDAASIDASGGSAGGTVLIGGDYQGANPAVANARRTGIAAGAAINADATGTGDGGTVIVWSDETTNFFGNISARGGASGGDGGFAEVSGKQHLSYRGSADLSAAAGERGTLLLDPSDLEIVGGSGDGANDGITRFTGKGFHSAAGEILFADSGPSVVYQSEIEAQSATADITLQATRTVSTRGNFTGNALTLAQDSNLLIETRNSGSGETGYINLIGSSSGPALNVVTTGSGTITVRSGVGGDRNTPILLSNLVSASDITVSAAGGAASSVIVFGELSGKNIDIDSTGATVLVSGARLVAAGNGTSLAVDASEISILDGTPGAATVSNSGTGTVSLTSSGTADIRLGDYAIATGVGLLSLSSGRSIVAINLTDVSDVVNEITSAGAVALRAAQDIGSGSHHIEIGGVTDLSLHLGDGDFHVSGADGAGGPGAALSRFALSLEPDAGNAYVLENFAGQAFDFSTQGSGDDLAIRSITSASLLNLEVTTRDEGIFIGGGGGAGIHLAGASAVMLDAHEGIDEAVLDDGGAVVAEITTDGRLTLVANDTIGGNGMLDVAATGGVSALEAASAAGSVRVNALQALRVEGSGVQTANGGTLAAGEGLIIAANVDTKAGMTFTAVDNGARAGNDLTISTDAVITLDSGSGAALTFNAGDNIVLAGGRIETKGAGEHRVELLADRENGGADGVTGAVSQTVAGLSVSAARLAIASGGGIGAGSALETEVETLSAINTTSGGVQISNRGDVVLTGEFRNDAQGGALTLINDNGAVDTGTAHVASGAGPLTLEARESDPAAVGDDARVNVGATGLQSAGADIAVRAADSITVGGPVDSGGGTITLQAGLDAIEANPDGIGDLHIAENIEAGAGAAHLGAGAAIQQLAGRIAAASVSSTSGGATTLDQPNNAIDRFASISGGNVSVRNSRALAVGASDVGGNLHIENAETVAIAELVRVAGTATLEVAAGDIDGAGGRIAAANVELDAAGGIGISAVLGTEVSGDLVVRSRGAGAAGDIRIHQHGNLATSQVKLLTTETGSAQTVSLAAVNVLTVDKDPVDTPHLHNGDRLELGAARIDLAEKISGRDVDVRFKAPVNVTAKSVFINLDQGLLTFEGNVSPGSNTTLEIRSEVAFASGHVTGKPDSTLIVADTLNLVTDTIIEVDNLFLSGSPASLTGSGDLTLLPATHGKDIVVGGTAGLVPGVTLATLQAFGGGRALNIGVPAFPTTNSPFAGNVTVARGLSVGNAVLTVGGLGDVTLDNHGDPLASDQAVNIVAVGDRRVFPGLVDHNGGDILDTDATVGASPTLKAPRVDLIAQARVGDADNALEVEVGPGGEVNFVTGASDAFINTVPAGQSVNNVVDSSTILAAFQAQGFFFEPLSRAALARTVGLETTGLETTGLGELLYIDDGVFLLPDPYTTPNQAMLLPALLDPDFPSDRRPDDPDDEAGWQSFYAGVLKDYVQSRYLIPEDASPAERAAVDARVETEWQVLVAFFEDIRNREQAALATGVATPGSGG